MVAYGLTERRQRDPVRTTSPASTRDPSRTPARPRTPRRAQTTTTPRSLAVTCDQVRGWAEQLERSPALLARLARERGWSRRTLADLEIGFDGERITVPIWRSAAPADRSERAVLQGLLRLRVEPHRASEGDRGSRHSVGAAAAAGVDPRGTGAAGGRAERHARRPLRRAASDRGARARTHGARSGRARWTAVAWSS